MVPLGRLPRHEEALLVLARLCLAYIREAEARRTSRRKHLLHKHHVTTGPVTLRDVWPDSVAFPDWLEGECAPCHGLMTMVRMGLHHGDEEQRVRELSVEEARTFLDPDA